MKGSLFLSFLIAFCAVQGNDGARTITDGSSTVLPNTTDGSLTAAPNTTDGSSTEAPNTTDGSSTETPNTTDGSSTEAPNTTDGSSTEAPNSTNGSSTVAPNSTNGSSTVAPNSTNGSSTAAPNSTDGSSTAAPNSTDGSSTAAPNSTDGSSTVALNTTDGSSTEAPNTTDGSSTEASNSTDGSSTVAHNTTGGSSTLAPNATEGLPPTTQEPLPCAKHPCKYGATCINLLQEYVCQCSYGLFYTPSGCQQGKIFPGQLQLTVPYENEMENITSSAYRQLYNNVTQFFSETFKDKNEYQQTILVSVKPFPSTSTRLRKAETRSNPHVTFINMFDTSTHLTENEVTTIVNEKLGTDSMFKNFSSVAQCDVYGCNADTTDCQNPKDDYQLPMCDCKPDLDKKNPKDKACLLCSDQCTSKNHKQCFQDERGIPYCSCRPDYEFKEGKCKPCNFGYSGKDCSNNFLAILTGVAIACGVVIVVLTGVLIYKSLRTRKESSETRSLLNNDYSSTFNSATNFAASEKIFPRVQARNPTVIHNKTVVENQGEQARYTQEPGIANRAYVPERDYDDDDDNTWLEMSSRGKF